MNFMISLLKMAVFSFVLIPRFFAQSGEKQDADALSISGHLDEKSAQLTITAKFPNQSLSSEKLIFTSHLRDKIFVSKETLQHETLFDFERLEGRFDEIVIGLNGTTTLNEVIGEHLIHWSLRHPSAHRRELVLSFNPEIPIDATQIIVKHSSEIQSQTFPLTTWRFPNPVLGTGKLTIVSDASLLCQLIKRKNLNFFETENHEIRNVDDADDEMGELKMQHFGFHGSTYDADFHIVPADPDAHRLVLSDMQIEGELHESSLSFFVQGIAKTQNPKGARLDLLGGKVALTEMHFPESVSIDIQKNAYQLWLHEAGQFPIAFRFEAQIEDHNGWKQTHFELPPATIFALDLIGFDEKTEFRFPSGASLKPRDRGNHRGFLPADGDVHLAWRERVEEPSTRLFFNTESFSQIRIGTGLMRQSTDINLHVMQGELESIVLDLMGEGEITQVRAEGLLSWELQSVDEVDENLRQLTIHFNQAQKNERSIRVETVVALAGFPVQIDPIRMTPKGSDRHHGSIEIINDGAVRLDIRRASGLSRIPSREMLSNQSNPDSSPIYPQQNFAFRHSLSDYELKVEATMIQPDIALSMLMIYHLDYDQTRIDADLELEIREAPIREFVLDLPADYVLAGLVSDQLTDFFLEPDSSVQQLRLVFSKPIFGRHSIRIGLEKNQALEGSEWTLGRILPKGIGQIRGHLGVTSIEGFRLIPSQKNGLVEIAGVYFPKKIEGLQSAFRLTGSDWELSMMVNAIPQSIEADAFHMFTLDNGMIRASSLFHFEISGSPLDALEFSVPAEYRNLAFTGKEVRNWSQDENQYLVKLQNPLIGAYTLLATYERPLSDDADTLDASGMIPKNTTSEQGTIVLASHRQIGLEELDLSENLIRLAPEELTDEKRLLIQQPILAAYQYNQRPLGLRLGLGTLIEASSLRQIVDRAEIQTRVAGDGQTLSTIRYLIKSSGLPHLKLTLPKGTQLWSAKVNQKKIIPIESADGTLLPLLSDEKDLRIVVLELAAMSETASPVRVQLPTLEVPVLHAQWHFEAAPKRKLRFLSGTLHPKSNDSFANGYDLFAAFLRGEAPWFRGAFSLLTIAFAALVLGVALLHFSHKTALSKRRWHRNLAHSLAALALIGGILGFVIMSLQIARHLPEERLDLDSQSTICTPNSAFEVHLENRPQHLLFKDFFGATRLLIIAALLWGIARFRLIKKSIAELAAWILLLLEVLNWQWGCPLALILMLAFFLRHFAFPPILNLRKKLAFLILTICYNVSAESIPDKVSQELRIEKSYAFGRAILHWKAEEHALLPLLRAPAILTKIDFGDARLRLISDSQKPMAQQLLAMESGNYEIHFEYQIPIADDANGFTLPTGTALIHRLEVALAIPNTTLKVPEAISLIPQNEPDSNETFWRILLPPKNNLRIDWVPRIRNRSQETPVFFAEWTHRILPSSSLIEGFHDLAIRPARGEISQVTIRLPADLAINAVCADALSNWHFDPETRRVQIDLSHPQSDPFLLRLFSQSPVRPLPYTANYTVPIAEAASGQVGTIALFAKSEIHVSDIEFENLVTMDPQDFTSDFVELCDRDFPSTTIRQTFRYTGGDALLSFRASEVTPHIVVKTSERLSLGEDRILLASEIRAQVSRAGIFALRFHLPEGLNMDTVSGDALSHWSERNHEKERIITLHLRRRCQGELIFNLTLSGSGLTEAKDWLVPKIRIGEAARQRGQLVIIPEQGIRLQAITRENISQIDARSQGFRMNGTLAFDLLNADWRLLLRLEQAAAWLEVASIQDVSFSEGKAQINLVLDIQIKNTAIKNLDLNLPSEALHVRFKGRDLADAIQSQAENGRQIWTLRLGRRIIGAYRLSIAYQSRIPETEPFRLRGIRVPNANAQRGFLTLRSEGRLQMILPELSDSLFPTDSNNLPQSLVKTLSGNLAISQTFRIVNHDYEIPIHIRRHPLASVLSAQIKSFHLTSLISARGSTLNRVVMDILPGSKRSLAVRLPSGSEFWFARVNRQGTTTWKQRDALLIPLTQNLSKQSELRVEFYYHSLISSAEKLDATLQGLGLDIPPSAVEWTIWLDPKWKLKSWSGNLELMDQSQITNVESAGLDAFIESENRRRAGRNQEAEDWLAQGNQFLNEGKDQLARHAFNNAFGLTQHDAAFNEDARIQLRTLKMQQAMAGIRVQQRQSKLASDALSSSMDSILTKTDPADENTLIHLADRLIDQHEDPAMRSRGFDITLPEQGTKLRFVKNVQVEDISHLALQIRADPKARTRHYGMLLGMMILFIGAAALGQKLQKPQKMPVLDDNLD